MKYGELTLGQMEAVVNKLGGMDGVKRFLAGNIEVVVKKILTLVETFRHVAGGSFVSAEKFRIGETDGVKIGWMGDCFKQNFLGKIENGVTAAELKTHKLEQDSLDAPIIEELGDAAETTLADLWELLEKQGVGQEGALLINGYANIFYIRDAHDELWAVHACWFADRGFWHVVACSITLPFRWRAGSQVVSR
ncbi:MAG: hypothetical protein PHV99_03680 [Candidatus Pacebacteria bacterium]|nr:hypothetical protein [Candidatus Paceibacterota bacterium]